MAPQMKFVFADVMKNLVWKSASTTSLTWIVKCLYLYAFARLRTSDTSQIVEPYGNPEKYFLRFFY